MMIKCLFLLAFTSYVQCQVTSSIESSGFSEDASPITDPIITISPIESPSPVTDGPIVPTTEEVPAVTDDSSEYPDTTDDSWSSVTPDGDTIPLVIPLPLLLCLLGDLKACEFGGAGSQDGFGGQSHHGHVGDGGFDNIFGGNRGSGGHSGGFGQGSQGFGGGSSDDQGFGGQGYGQISESGGNRRGGSSFNQNNGLGRGQQYGNDDSESSDSESGEFQGFGSLNSPEGLFGRHRSNRFRRLLTGAFWTTKSSSHPKTSSSDSTASRPRSSSSSSSSFTGPLEPVIPGAPKKPVYGIFTAKPATIEVESDSEMELTARKLPRSQNRQGTSSTRLTGTAQSHPATSNGRSINGGRVYSRHQSNNSRSTGRNYGDSLV
ncbi:unnamed protein product [Bursaphelenchus okinawaensis]|uniref:Uncharacterized protein n=1 Tax=Bursaphelenchus okinawaensis TaxID=465554 RepID=A0A811KWJ4_9BILA|nr:unnamed protein product [Bursaphelenchus okinawaensis]CAG9113049.1 unnamed protein product [Bursaphelenchus okinawaensis]